MIKQHSAELTKPRKLSHEMNNSLNAITLGLHVLAQYDDADIQFIVHELQSEISDLQAFIAELVRLSKEAKG